ncbi:MAG TPA: hypothetical protein VH186_10450 [Chloroflexia bacterium]|nr:hypothetical protein [Chloroflexia bacterium]
MADLPAVFLQKQWALRKKYESIEAELQAWKTLSSSPPLDKHYSQVQRLANALQGMVEVVKGEVDRLEQPADQVIFFKQAQRAEFLILEVHRTWNFFREKLVFRQSPPFNEVLEALDEFVWACYSPVIEVAKAPRTTPPGPPFIEAEAVREPPLTFFNSDWSPAASARLAPLPLEETADSGEAPNPQARKLSATRLVTLLIPVIALPWFNVTFLPESLLLAHETAHLLDFDLNLSDNISRNLRAAGPAIAPERLEQYWLPWSAEIFADLFAVVCLGPAFAGALQTLLTRSPNEVLHALDGQNHYPPHHLRVLITLKGLESCGFGNEAAILRQNWNRAYGEPVEGEPGVYAINDYLLSECEQDIEAVVSALLDAPFEALDNQSFKALKSLCWNASDQQTATKVSASLLKKGLPLPTSNPRQLLAGAQLAFQQQPEELLNEGAANRKTQLDLLKQILQTREPGRRGTRKGHGTSPADLLKLAQSDQRKGSTLGAELLQQYSI